MPHSARQVSLMMQEIIDHMLSPKPSHLSVLVGQWAGSLLGGSAVQRLVHHHAEHDQMRTL